MALIAVTQVWDKFHMPTLAWGAEVQSLKEESVKQGVDLYSMQLWKFINSAPKSNDPEVMRVWQEIVDEKRKELKLYERRYLDLQLKK